MLPIVVLMIVSTFAAQLVLCFRAGRRWVKGIPLYFIGLGELACGAGYFLFDHVYGAAFAAVIYTGVLMIMLLGDGFAWLIYLLVKKYKTRNKSL